MSYQKSGQVLDMVGHVSDISYETSNECNQKCKHIDREKQNCKHPLTHIDRIFHYLYALDYYLFTTNTISVYRIYDVNRNDYKLL